ncbi:MAG: nucleotidyltransferase domain-containing protein, partial [Gemmatimonadota bacterium]|nr:nucleotidyltransferase domain-containing protein [Gemmatimonadota bacterium]
MPVSASAIPDEYRADVARAVEICKAEGCRDVFIFGSVTAGRHRSQSDLDIAVRGCPTEHFYRLLG